MTVAFCIQSSFSLLRSNRNSHWTEQSCLWWLICLPFFLRFGCCLFRGYISGSSCSTYWFGAGFSWDALNDTTLSIYPSLEPALLVAGATGPLWGSVLLRDTWLGWGSVRQTGSNLTLPTTQEAKNLKCTYIVLCKSEGLITMSMNVISPVFCFFSPQHYLIIIQRFLGFAAKIMQG